MKKDICICSISQPTDRGFIPFAKDIEYDLDSMHFHADPGSDKVIRESLRIAYFKSKPIEINKPQTGGKKK